MIYWIVRFINLYRPYIILALLIVTSLFLISLNESAKIKPVRKLSFVLLSLSRNIISPIEDIIYAKSENQKLLKENAELISINQRLIKHEFENLELKRLLKFKTENPQSLIIGKVIFKKYDATGNSFIVDKGYEDGVKLNSTVISFNGLVGNVIDVYRNYSVVNLIKNTSIRISIRSKRNNTLGILAWDGEKFKVYNVNKSADVQVGDIFLTSEFSTTFPAGIPVVRLKSVLLPSGLLFFDITAESIVDIDNIRHVIFVEQEKSTFIFSD